MASGLRGSEAAAEGAGDWPMITASEVEPSGAEPGSLPKTDGSAAPMAAASPGTDGAACEPPSESPSGPAWHAPAAAAAALCPPLVDGSAWRVCKAWTPTAIGMPPPPGTLVALHTVTAAPIEGTVDGPVEHGARSDTAQVRRGGSAPSARDRPAKRQRQRALERAEPPPAAPTPLDVRLLYHRQA